MGRVGRAGPTISIVAIIIALLAGVAIGYFIKPAEIATKTITIRETPPQITSPPTKTTITPAQEIRYPTRQVTVLVGWGVGGGTDNAARIFAAILGNMTGVPWVVNNMPGANGAIAEAELLNRPADGYVILFSPAAFIANQITRLNPNPVDKYKFVARLQDDVGALMIRADETRFKNWQEFVEYAKKGMVTIGGTGKGTIDEINTVLLAKAAGIEKNIRYVPYDKAGDMHKDLIGGHIDAMYEEPSVVIDLIKANKIKPLIFFNDKRISEFPDVPATAELYPQYKDRLTIGNWRGVIVRAEVPDEIFRKLVDLLKKAYDSPEYKKWERENYLHLREGWAGPDDFRRLYEQQYQIYREVLKELGYI